MKKLYRTRSGFTLVELLLYIGIASSILFVSTLFLQALLESRVKNQTIAEVEQQGMHVMHIITQAIRNADAINTPTTGNNAVSLSIHTYTATLDPTIFDLSDGTIRIKEGSGNVIVLTNSRVTASSLNFQNFSRPSTPGIIRISFILTHTNPSGRQEYNFNKTFSASAALRQP